MPNLATPNLRLRALAIGFAAAAIAGPAVADPVADFYKGKNIELIIGFTQGGGYDVYARTVMRHMTSHIPGQPAVVPKQMTGAGSRKAAAYVYNVAPKDGTVIGATDQSMPVQQALGESLQFDSTKFNWIGNPNADINTLAFWHTANVKSVDDLKKKETVVGATGPNTSAQYPQVMNNLLGTKMKIITGYPGGADINLAMERGEVQGRGSNAWASWKSTKADWLKDGKVDIIVQIGLKKADDLPNVPLLMDLATNDKDRAALKLLSSGTAIGRPLYTTPDTPKDRVAALRKAFNATMKDKAFLAEAEKMNLDLNPVGGAELQDIVADVVATPPAVAKHLVAALDGHIMRDLVQEKSPAKPAP
ncbi:MAG: Bug family tripartite tricarboxylate transporter substrate binding protein [Alphaproteobacteria bacterium]